MAAIRRPILGLPPDQDEEQILAGMIAPRTRDLTGQSQGMGQGVLNPDQAGSVLSDEPLLPELPPMPNQPGSRNTGVAGPNPAPGGWMNRATGERGGPDFLPPAGSRAGGSAMQRYGTGNIPGAEGLTWGDNALSGFNTNAWSSRPSDYDADTIKNSFGKIASRYPPRPSSIPLILADPDFQRLFPGAQQVGFDKIDFGDGPVDVGQAFNPDDDSGTAWWWGVGSEGGGAAAGSSAGGTGTSGLLPTDDGGGLSLDDLMQTGEDALSADNLARIMEQIQMLVSGQNPAEDEALAQMIGRRG